MTVLGLPILIFLGLLFLSSALAKLRNPERFAAAVAGYDLLPALLVQPFARALPIVEAATGAACLAGIGLAGGGALLLLTAFSAGMLWNIGRGRTAVDCGCLGGVRAEPVSWSVILRNALLALLSLAAIVASTPSGLDSEWRHVEGGGIGAVAAALAAVSALVLFLLTVELRVLLDASREVRPT